MYVLKKYHLILIFDFRSLVKILICFQIYIHNAFSLPFGEPNGRVNRIKT